jgi:hypothetical protein
LAILALSVDETFCVSLFRFISGPTTPMSRVGNLSSASNPRFSSSGCEGTPLQWRMLLARNADEVTESQSFHIFEKPEWGTTMIPATDELAPFLGLHPNRNPISSPSALPGPECRILGRESCHESQFCLLSSRNQTAKNTDRSI